MGAWELVINGASAVGSLGAAGVALWLSRKSDRVRQREREDAAFAQARLITVEVHPTPRVDEFEAVVRNYGREPVLDFSLKSVLLMPEPLTLSTPVSPEGGYVPVLSPAGFPLKIVFVFKRQDGTSPFSDADGARRKKDPADLYAIFEFTDANDTYWQLSWSVDEVTLTRLARDYKPKDVIAIETERGVRHRQRRTKAVERKPVEDPIAKILEQAPKRRIRRMLRRIGRRSD